jgi:hypothetical protein
MLATHSYLNRVFSISASSTEFRAHTPEGRCCWSTDAEFTDFKDLDWEKKKCTKKKFIGTKNMNAGHTDVIIFDNETSTKTLERSDATTEFYEGEDKVSMPPCPRIGCFWVKAALGVFTFVLVDNLGDAFYVRDWCRPENNCFDMKHLGKADHVSCRSIGHHETLNELNWHEFAVVLRDGNVLYTPETKVRVDGWPDDMALVHHPPTTPSPGWQRKGVYPLPPLEF